MDETTYLSVTNSSFQSDEGAMQICLDSPQQPTSVSTKSSGKKSSSSSKDKKRSHSDKKKRIKLIDKLEFNKSEIVFITEINIVDKIFFGQLARYTNEELRQFGELIDTKLGQLYKQNGPAKKTNKGHLVGARFSDGRWYRAIIEDKSNTNKEAIVSFIDWGNSCQLTFDDIVEDVASIEEMNHDPFGVFCSCNYLTDASEEQVKNFYLFIANRYLLIKPKDKIKDVLQVDIPMVAYNSRFWRAVIPGWQLKPTHINDNPFKVSIEKTMVECKN